MQQLLVLLLAAVAGIQWSRPVELATGGGERGPWQQNNSRYDFVDDPSVALMANGNAGVVWVDQARKDVFWQIVAPDGHKRLATPVNISRTPGEFSWLPRIALSPHDPSHVYVLWQEIIFSGGPHGGEIFFARSTDGGRTWRSRGSLEPAGYATRVVPFSANAAWRTGPGGEVYRTTDGEHWSPVATTGDQPGESADLFAALDADTAAYLRSSTLYVTHDGGVHWSGHPVPRG